MSLAEETRQESWRSAKRIIVFAPHPDDETLGCGGTIARRISEGYDVMIVIMTNGEYALLKTYGIDSDPTPDQLKSIRREEVKRAARRLGVGDDDLLFLDLVDGTIAERREEVVEKVTRILEEYAPREIYFPSKKDSNIDHQAANQTVVGSASKLNPGLMKYEYSILQKYARIGPFADQMFNLFLRNLKHVDISEFLRVKKAAINEFKSQITIMSDKQRQPVLGSLERFSKRYETFFVRHEK